MSPTIDSRHKLKEWLSDKPIGILQALAPRISLRVLPLLSGLTEGGVSPKQECELLLSVFRANFLSTVEASTPDGRTTLIEAARAAEKAVGQELKSMVRYTVGMSAAYAASRWTPEAAYAAHTATRYAAMAAEKAASAASANSLKDAIDAALKETQASSDAIARISGESAKEIVWGSITDDINFLSDCNMKNTIYDLLASPLWIGGNIPSLINDHWSNLKEKQIFIHAGFQVWFDMYDEVLLPKKDCDLIFSINSSIAQRIASQTDEWWSRTPNEINDEITQWIYNGPSSGSPPEPPEPPEPPLNPDSGADVSSQVPAAFKFGIEDDRIGLIPSDGMVNNPSIAQEFLDDLRERAIQAGERLESAGNAVPFLAAEVARLRDFLPTAATDLNPFLLRCRLASIDGSVTTLQTAGPSRELADDPTMQVTALSIIGRELMLCFPDLRTRERDHIARAVQGQERQIAEALAPTPEAAAAARDVVTEDAAAGLAVMAEMVHEAAEGPAEALRERIVEQVMVDRNFRSEVVRFGSRLVDEVQSGMLDEAKAVSKQAVVFGFAGLVGVLANPVLGGVALFAGYGQINRGLKLVEEYFTKHAKDLKGAAKTPKAEG